MCRSIQLFHKYRKCACRDSEVNTGQEGKAQIQGISPEVYTRKRKLTCKYKELIQRQGQSI
jgi:hypothetical protein